MSVPFNIYAVAAVAAALWGLTTILRVSARKQHAEVRARRGNGVERQLLLATGVVLALALTGCNEPATGGGRKPDPNADTAPAQEATDTTAGAPVHVEDKDHFANVTAKGRVLVDFYADWCGPCKALAPVLKEIAKENSETLTVAKVDVDDHRDLAMAYGVRGIPHLVLLQDGETVDTLTGFRSKRDLDAWLKGAGAE